MRRRLVVVLSESELDEIRRRARREGISVGEWVRRTPREARSRQPVHEPERKLKAVRRAAKHSLPTREIDQMLEEIERGCQE